MASAKPSNPQRRASAALDDNAIQSQKYTPIARFQLFLKVFVPLASTRHIMRRGVIACAPTGFLQGDLTDRP